ncbi:MutS protein msh5 [Lunasporangiospora selenospora]|uniref:MutS protein msh5 n=1 Tax=Lunasporangiospora selenospora TaxID=979761 RepID=A0A9P6KHE9_9FUNG|nr:MutS protein msh5 [Lunasporangiospora selenospora]
MLLLLLSPWLCVFIGTEKDHTTTANIPQTPKRESRAQSSAPGSGRRSSRRRSRSANPPVTPLRALADANQARVNQLILDANRRGKVGRDKHSPMGILRVLSRIPGFNQPSQPTPERQPIPGSSQWRKLTPKSPRTRHIPILPDEDEDGLSGYTTTTRPRSTSSHRPLDMSIMSSVERRSFQYLKQSRPGLDADDYLRLWEEEAASAMLRRNSTRSRGSSFGIPGFGSDGAHLDENGDGEFLDGDDTQDLTTVIQGELLDPFTNTAAFGNRPRHIDDITGPLDDTTRSLDDRIGRSSSAGLRLSSRSRFGNDFGDVADLGPEMVDMGLDLGTDHYLEEGQEVNPHHSDEGVNMSMGRTIESLSTETDVSLASESQHKNIHLEMSLLSGHEEATVDFGLLGPRFGSRVGQEADQGDNEEAFVDEKDIDINMDDGWEDILDGDSEQQQQQQQGSRQQREEGLPGQGLELDSVQNSEQTLELTPTQNLHMDESRVTEDDPHVDGAMDTGVPGLGDNSAIDSRAEDLDQMMKFGDEGYGPDQGDQDQQFLMEQEELDRALEGPDGTNLEHDQGQERRGEEQEEEEEREEDRLQQEEEEEAAGREGVQYFDDFPSELGIMSNGNVLPTSQPEPKKKTRKTKSGGAVPSMPTSLQKQLVHTFSRARVSREAMEAVLEGSHMFFEQVSDDLAAYAEHAGRRTIDESDVECLMQSAPLFDNTRMSQDSSSTLSKLISDISDSGSAPKHSLKEADTTAVSSLPHSLGPGHGAARHWTKRIWEDEDWDRASELTVQSMYSSNKSRPRTRPTIASLESDDPRALPDSLSATPPPLIRQGPRLPIWSSRRNKTSHSTEESSSDPTSPSPLLPSSLSERWPIGAAQKHTLVQSALPVSPVPSFTSAKVNIGALLGTVSSPQCAPTIARTMDTAINTAAPSPSSRVQSVEDIERSQQQHPQSRLRVQWQEPPITDSESTEAPTVSYDTFTSMGDEAGFSRHKSIPAMIIILAVNMRGKTMGCAYYDGRQTKLRVMQDMALCSAVDMVEIIKAQVRPSLILTSARLDEDVLMALQFNDAGEETATDIRPSSDFSFQIAKSRLVSVVVRSRLWALNASPEGSSSSSRRHGDFRRSTRLADVPGMDEATQKHAQLYLSNVIDLQSVESVSCAGAIINFMSRHSFSQQHATRDNPGLTIYAIDSFSLQGFVCLCDSKYSEIFEDESHPSMHSSTRGRKEGLSLYGIMNQTKTSQGKYLLKQWFLQPSRDLDTISSRHQTVDCFCRVENQPIVGQLSSCLSHIKNIPKILGTLPRKASLAEWQALLQFVYYSLKIYSLCQDIISGEAPILQQIRERFMTQDLRDIGAFINKVVDFDESVNEGRCIVKHNVDEELDKMRHTYHGLDSFLSEIAKEISQTIPFDFTPLINVIYFPQLGYLITVPMNPNWKTENDFHLEGLSYQFSTETTVYYKNKAMRDEHLGDIHGLIVDREIDILQGLQERVLDELCAELDVLVSFANTARIRNYKRPNVTEDNVLHIVNGRHPLQELVVSSFVTNDTHLGDIGAGSRALASDVNSVSATDSSRPICGTSSVDTRDSFFDNKVMILSGANSSGKSVYLKQVALITYMAHVGSFVPAESAVIGLTDKILTRLQTRETVSSIQSAFMTDLQQTNLAIRMATRRSLVVLDEFGKGTATTDGAGLFCGVIEYFAKLPLERRPRVMATTHFHELFENDLLDLKLPISLFAMEVYQEPQGLEATFLFRRYEMIIPVLTRNELKLQKLYTKLAEMLLELDLTPGGEELALERQETVSTTGSLCSKERSPRAKRLKLLLEEEGGREREDDDLGVKSEEKKDLMQAIDRLFQLSIRVSEQEHAEEDEDLDSFWKRHGLPGANTKT